MKRTVLTDSDRCRLGRLLASDDARGVAPWTLLDQLECQLEAADAVRPESIPDDVVTMNSTVRLVNVTSGVEFICTVVYPEDVEMIEEGLSVLDSLGTRLIGRKVGDVVECENRIDRGPWLVAEVLFQPERAGAYHL